MIQHPQCDVCIQTHLARSLCVFSRYYFDHLRACLTCRIVSYVRLAGLISPFEVRNCLVNYGTGTRYWQSAVALKHQISLMIIFYTGDQIIICFGELINIIAQRSCLLDPLELMEWADFRQFCIVFQATWYFSYFRHSKAKPVLQVCRRQIVMR